MVLLHGNLDIVAYGARTTRVSRRKHNAGRYLSYLPDGGCLCWTADPWEADSGYYLSAYAGMLRVAADRAVLPCILVNWFVVAKVLMRAGC